MERYTASLLSSFSPHPQVTLLRVAAPGLAGHLAPGQFVMARLAGAGWDPFLREPLFAAGIDAASGAVTLWAPGGSALRERIRALPLHETLDLLGPFGRGLAAHREWRQLLLVAEGLAVGPLLAIMERALSQGQTVTLVSLERPGQTPYPADALPLSIEYQRLPQSEGVRLPLEALRWADGVVAAGSQAFYRSVAEALREARPGQRGGFGYGLMLEPFGWQGEAQQWGAPAAACGISACRACVVELRRDRVLACARGPLFDLWGL